MRSAACLGLLVFLAPIAACSSAQSAGNGAGGGAASTSTGPSASSGTTGSGGGSDSWASYAKGFFATYCVECHSASDPARDYTGLPAVKKDLVKIRCGVASVHQAGCGTSPAPKQFPITDSAGTNPKPSDAERDRIVAWVNAGAP